MGGANGDAAEKQEEEGRRKFAVLLCAEDSEYMQKSYGGYFKVFVRLLGEEGETWHVYRAAHGELPTADEADAYDGFVITGSCNDAEGDDPWIQGLVVFLKALDVKKKKVLGVCFGHQILSRALGGKTGRAKKGWDIGVTCIHPSRTIIDMQSPLDIPSHLPVIEFHRDEVWQLPPQAEVLAWSDKTGIEMFRYEDHILGIQGHPEYNKDIFLHLVDRLLQRNLIQTCHAEKAKRSIDTHELDREAWKRLCKGFLKGNLSW
ncbi:gamma-glutamyl peptidase 5-like [Zingiber officinale]|uniref:gamma-glutamyl peptidase 5-like n=1 Tax=Zingiber officinale TaxID=94328 RepID=UPI001C4CBC4D|nr:gamma-glutamyl peptidase 5-like [Zingiber officinale]